MAVIYPLARPSARSIGDDRQSSGGNLPTRNLTATNRQRQQRRQYVTRMAHMKWVLVQYRPIIVFRSQVSKLVCTWRQQWIEQVVALQLKYERATEAREAAARLLCEANEWAHQWVHLDPLAISIPSVRIHLTQMLVCYLVTLKNVICLKQR